MAPLPPRDQRHAWLRYEGQEYTDEIIHDFEERLSRIFSRQVHRLRMEHTVAGGSESILSFLEAVVGDSWTIGTRVDASVFSPCRFTDTVLDLDAVGLHIVEEMGTVGFGSYSADSLREIATKADLRDYRLKISSDSDFLSMVPSYTYITDPLRRLYHRLIAFKISKRGQAPEMVITTDLFILGEAGGEDVRRTFFTRLAKNFKLITEESLQGLIVVV
ncbi:hypothetical protein Tco_0068179, partial [Tanacetum coccineum]